MTRGHFYRVQFLFLLFGAITIVFFPGCGGKFLMMLFNPDRQERSSDSDVAQSNIGPIHFLKVDEQILANVDTTTLSREIRCMLLAGLDTNSTLKAGNKIMGNGN